MKLLFVTNMYPPFDVGGYEQQCQEFAEALRQKGHHVHILTSRYGIKRSLRPNESDISRALFLEADPYHYRPSDFILYWRLQVESNYREVKGVVSEVQPDIALVWGMWLLSRQIPYWLEEQLPGRVAYYIASYWPIEEDTISAYWKMPANRLVTNLVKGSVRPWVLSRLNRSDYAPKLVLRNVACCSQYVRKIMLSAGRIPQNAEVIYPGIDPDPILNSPTATIPPISSCSRLHLLYFGTLREGKGVHTALEAMGLLRQQGLLDSVDLTIIGDGDEDYKARLWNMAVSLDIADSVQFAGRVPRCEIPTLLKRYHVFLFTSIWPEPFGRTIVEAMAAGLAVIGSDVGGSQEIFEQYPEDMLFQPEDALGLSNRIRRLLDDPELIPSLAKAGQKIVLERFTLRKCSDEIEEWLKGISHEASVRNQLLPTV